MLPKWCHSKQRERQMRTPRVRMHLCKYEIIMFDPNIHSKSSFSTVSFSPFISSFHPYLSFIPNSYCFQIATKKPGWHNEKLRKNNEWFFLFLKKITFQWWSAISGLQKKQLYMESGRNQIQEMKAWGSDGQIVCLGNRVLGGLSTNEERRREMEDSLGKKEKKQREEEGSWTLLSVRMCVWCSVRHTACFHVMCLTVLSVLISFVWHFVFPHF